MPEVNWTLQAEKFLEQALAETRDGIDAIPTVSAALAALRIEAGELPAAELTDLYAEDAECVCPPDLLGRGGFRGCCPAQHAPTPAPLPLGGEPEPGDVWKVSDETVPIGGVAAGTTVSCPAWNDGRPVLILGNQDSPVDLSQTYVTWRPADAVWPDTRSARVDSDMQVTPCTLNGTPTP